jgi:hypothetical protein
VLWVSISSPSKSKTIALTATSTLWVISHRQPR